MNKSELIAGISEKAGLKKQDAEKMLSGFVEAVTEELAKGEKVQLVGFASFEITERKARKGTNPQTGKKMKIPASKAVKFRAGKTLRDAVNN
jgi:DNA-binding protein HU-beta